MTCMYTCVTDLVSTTCSASLCTSPPTSCQTLVGARCSNFTGQNVCYYPALPDGTACGNNGSCITGVCEGGNMLYQSPFPLVFAILNMAPCRCLHQSGCYM